MCYIIIAAMQCVNIIQFIQFAMYEVIKISNVLKIPASEVLTFMKLEILSVYKFNYIIDKY